jgi:hypothetical protein
MGVASARQVKFHEAPTQLLHSVHADSACTVCGKHFIVQSELLAMCPSRSTAAPPVAAAAASKLPPADKPLLEYSIEEVCAWVEALQMDATLWRENTITGRDLKHLSDEELKATPPHHCSLAVCALSSRRRLTLRGRVCAD